jgi:hypothetical protein
MALEFWGVMPSLKKPTKSRMESVNRKSEWSKQNPRSLTHV